MDKSPIEAARISLEDLVELTSKAVIRAVEARGTGEKLPIGPIIVGIIWYPQGIGTSPGVFAQAPGELGTVRQPQTMKEK